MLKNKGCKNVHLEPKNGRLYLHGGEDEQAAVENVLDRLAGISGWSQTKSLPKNIEEIFSACIEEAKKIQTGGLDTFKIEARRIDKSFPFDSYSMRCKCGESVLEAVPGLKVDVHKPGAVIYIEIREKAYVYSDTRKGLNGLPVGTAGRGLLLLSGGIDSPVAGFLMALRGMNIDAVHFHAYPYTSVEAKEKVIRLAKTVAGYTMGINLNIIGFTEIQKRIKERSPEQWATVLLRMAMMKCAEKIATTNKCKCIITGESLSQVASQTVENISCTQSGLTIPVLQPLIGMDKETIIQKARQIGTYAISIEPYEDCCVLFTPPHPVLRGNPIEASKLYTALELEPLIEEALEECETSVYTG